MGEIFYFIIVVGNTKKILINKLIIRVELAKFFELSVSEAFESIKEQILACGGNPIVSNINIGEQVLFKF